MKPVLADYFTKTWAARGTKSVITPNEDAETFYPPKPWHVAFPAGVIDNYGATSRNCRSKQEAYAVAREMNAKFNPNWRAKYAP